MRNLRPLTAILLSLLAAPAFARSAAEIKLELKKLTVVGSALYVAAHPDDENTAMLAYLANDRLVRTGYLSCTRGDGGQNLLGNEKGELLGLIRTQELLAARRIDGAEQWFTRALDFGFTKSPQETLSIWDRDKVLADVVWVIRLTQPDVIITRFPTTGEGGHGQHTASAILAEEAFRIAGDPTKFPEQLQYVTPWQPKRIFWNRFNFRAIDPNTPGLENDLKVDVGAYNALLGRSYTEIAGDSRSMHKSQGFGAAERRGTAVNYLRLTGGEPAKSDAFDGVNLTWSRYAGGEREGALLQQAYDTFDFANPAKSIPILLQAVGELDRLGATPAWSSKTNPWIAVKRRELLDAIRDCAGLSIDVSAADSAVTPGGQLPVSVTVVNRSDFPLRLQTVAGAYVSPGKAPDVALQNNQPAKVDIALKVPDDEAYSQPYWMRHPPAKGMYIVDDQRLIGRPENPPPLSIAVGIGTSPMQTIVFNLPVVYRWVDAVRGEQVRTVDVVPPVTANLDEAVYLFPDAKAKTIGVKVRGKGDVALEVPQGWRAANLTVTPPAGESTGTVRAMIGGHVAQQVYEINYPHIPAQRVFSDAAAKLVHIHLQRAGQHIGYIMGSGDDVDDFLRQAGYDVTLLSDDDLNAGDFARFDAIVAGVRAYNTRPEMKTAHARLMKYVETGGTYVVQYNSLSPQPLLVDPPGPYPFKVANERVTVEEAPVKMLDPASPLLTTPNKITEADFNGWVQERGLYFARDWDPRYKTVLESHDPGEPEHPGGELYTRYGKGVFIYTSYAWFRQLPAGVPGAYRLFVNLVSAR